MHDSHVTDDLLSCRHKRDYSINEPSGCFTVTARDNGFESPIEFVFDGAAVPLQKWSTLHSSASAVPHQLSGSTRGRRPRSTVPPQQLLVVVSCYFRLRCTDTVHFPPSLCSYWAAGRAVLTLDLRVLFVYVDVGELGDLELSSYYHSHHEGLF